MARGIRRLVQGLVAIVAFAVVKVGGALMSDTEEASKRALRTSMSTVVASVGPVNVALPGCPTILGVELPAPFRPASTELERMTEAMTLSAIASNTAREGNTVRVFFDDWSAGGTLGGHVSISEVDAFRDIQGRVTRADWNDFVERMLSYANSPNELMEAGQEALERYSEGSAGTVRTQAMGVPEVRLLNADNLVMISDTVTDIDVDGPTTVRHVSAGKFSFVGGCIVHSGIGVPRDPWDPSASHAQLEWLVANHRIGLARPASDVAAR